MKVYKIIGALIEGILFAVLMWIGDKYILDNDNAFYVYIIQAIIFALAMYLFDRFFNKKK
ncbi:MAG: hypothetical protein II271_00440 [Muribaculaceae bacterium]|jgi:hypothetical protein|nr:hypothetical protein [Muribaculaceae bacterium]MEE1366759.1 hypothetical protein [Muribaculaceae bacterium]